MKKIYATRFRLQFPIVFGKIAQLRPQILNKTGKASIWLALLASCIVLSSFRPAQPAAAQAADENWTVPINLSRSGAASNPVLVTSADSRFHVIWSDQFAGTMYTNGNGIEWEPPVAVTLPFGIFTPRLLADSEGMIYAFWLDEDNRLLGSRVEAASFANSRAWTSPERLAESAVALDVAVDEAGQIHVTYAQSLDVGTSAPGIYYRKSGTVRGRWLAPVPLDSSPYFRSLTPQTARVRLAVVTKGETQNVYVAWDNVPRKRVFMSQSFDGGETWETAREVDAPIEGSITGGPTNVIVYAEGDNVLLLWQNNRSGSNCSQYYQWSSDGGSTWQERQRILEDVPGCPQENQVFAGQGLVYLMSAINQQMYLLAWDGSRWSAPQPQLTLSGFIDPDTFKMVDFGCRQAAVGQDGALYVVGCDLAGGNDIWTTSRRLEDVSNWFTQGAVWSRPASIAAGQMRLLTPTLLADAYNRMHLFWSQGNSAAGNAPGMVLYYAQHNDGEWSDPVAVLNSPLGKAEQPSAVVDTQDRISVVWSGGQAGEIYFSQAPAARALVKSAWSDPVALPSPVLAGSSPDLVVDSQGILYVVYSVPLNEQRGIYFTRSEDGGQNWSQATLVFDAEALDWPMVDKPHLAWTENRQLHLIWTQLSLPGGVGPLGLYYARSEDKGDSWSQAETVMEGPAVWSELTGVGERTVHRFWQDQNNGRTTLWHEHSPDSGVTWTRISPVSIFGETITEPAMTIDRTGRLHLMLVVDRGTERPVLQHWLWNGEGWQTDQSLDLSGLAASRLGGLVVAVSPQGDLGISLHGDTENQLNGLSQAEVFFTNRTLELPGTAPTPLPPLTPTPIPDATSTPGPTPSPTPVLLSPENRSFGFGGLGDDPNNAGSNWIGSIIGPLAAGVIVLVVFIVGTRRSRYKGRY